MTSNMTLASRSLLLSMIFGATAVAVPGEVTHHQKLSRTEGGIDVDPDIYWQGFGRSCARLGDLNGDGRPEVAIGVPYLTQDVAPFCNACGSVWILSLNADGTVFAQQRIESGLGGLPFLLDEEDNFGRAMEAVGDLDGDGLSELAVGAPGDDDGGTGHGAVWILFLNSDATVRAWTKISETAGGFSGALVDLDDFGGAIAAPGDLDGDDVPDLFVSAPGTVGEIYTLLLNADGTVKSHAMYTPTVGGSFGRALAMVGDVDGDSTSDLAVGAYADGDGGGFQRGAVWILFLNPDGTVRETTKISDTAGGFEGELHNNAAFGWSVAGIGDVDGNGVSDVAAGAIGWNSEGCIWLLFLNADGTVADELQIADGVGGFTGFILGLDNFGSAIECVGDVNGDGVDDLVVGAQGDNDGPVPNEGAAYVLFLAGEGPIVVPDGPIARFDARVCPNPALRTGRFEVTLPESGDYRIDLFDVTGRNVHTLWNAPVAGSSVVLSLGERALGPGTYFLRVERQGQSATSSVILD